MMLNNRIEADALLKKLGAPPRLLLHLNLVGEAADELIQALANIGIRFDANFVELGAAIHDVGKIEFQDELDGPGSRHESAGESLLLLHGVQPAIAHCCVSHADWMATGVSFEELLVALSDKLWKGKREPTLELLVINEVAARMQLERWDIFSKLDLVFEEIAAGGDARLLRSLLASQAS